MEAWGNLGDKVCVCGGRSIFLTTTNEFVLKSKLNLFLDKK